MSKVKKNVGDTLILFFIIIINETISLVKQEWKNITMLLNIQESKH